MMTVRQMVELFHLIFCRALFANAGDKTLLAIKGGINLRFFFGSVRFSEDLDVDVMTMAKATLENRVDRVLKGPVAATLKARNIVIRELSKPKQTETVQRWKLLVASSDASVEARTKVEFSRRHTVEESHLDPVAAEIANSYGMPAFLATHYRCPEAVRQKIQALAERSETQPRDVFDLQVLLVRTDAPLRLDDEARGWLDAAIENAMELTYEQYVALVVAFLDPEHREIYESRATWDAMLLDVVERLERLR
jgi:predicted nucleotidyltransferase component of viral defense system